MKTITVLFLIGAILLVPSVGRANDDDVFWGALLGAGTGLILGETIDGVHGSVAVPIGALAGGLIGYELNRDGYRYGWRQRTWSPTHYDAPYFYYGRPVYGPLRRPRRVKRVKRKAQKPATTFKAPDYHPGVDVVKVQIRMANGVAADVRLLRMADDTFVGPQGEVYKTLPKASELTQYTVP